MAIPGIKKIISVTAVVAAIAFAAGCGGIASGSVAKVYDRMITEAEWTQRVNMLALGQGKTAEDLDAELRDKLNREAALQLVNEELMRREAEDRGLTVTDEEVQASVDKILELRFAGDQEQLTYAIEAKGATDEEFRQGLRTQMLQSKLEAVIISEMVVTDEDARAFFDNYAANYKSPEFRTFKQIVVADEALAKELRARVDAGEDLATLAGQYSIDQQSKSYGGQTGFGLDREDPDLKPVKDAVFGLGSYGIAGPIKAAKGYYVVQLASVSPDKNTEFEPLLEEFRDKVRGKKQGEAWGNFLKAANEKADVEYQENVAPIEAEEQ